MKKRDGSRESAAGNSLGDDTPNNHEKVSNVRMKKREADKLLRQLRMLAGAVQTKSVGAAGRSSASQGTGKGAPEKLD